MHNIDISGVDICTVGICGIGFVGGALKYSFEKLNIEICLYDKYKHIGSFNNLLTTEIVFLCLPTLYNDMLQQYDTSSLYEVCQELSNNNYKGIVVIKSTVTTGTCELLNSKYPTLKIIHNPEFLTARTANIDFHQQSHIVLGKTTFCQENAIKIVSDFFRQNYPNAEVSQTSSSISESMKSFCNSFYSVKIAFFNELYQYCQAKNIDYQETRDLMLKNGWINKMHTDVPGPDGQLGFGGACFPKDASALLSDMKTEGVIHKILQAVVKENYKIRNTDVKEHEIVLNVDKEIHLVENENKNENDNIEISRGL